MTTNWDLQQAVSAFGRVNYEVPCTVDGEPARIVMDETRVAIVAGTLGAAVGPVLEAPFLEAEADRAPDSLDVRLHIAGTALTAAFADDADAARFVRVLGVRRQTEQRRGAEVPTRFVPSSYSGRRPPADEYERWAEHTMVASTVLLVIGWLNLALGIVVAAVIAANGGGPVAVLWLVFAAAGCALPLCLGALARTVVLRFRQADGDR